MQFWINTIHGVEKDHTVINSFIKKLASMKSINVKSFGKTIPIKIGGISFYSYKNLYGESSYKYGCRETLTTDIINQTEKRLIGRENITFVFSSVYKDDAVVDISNSSIKKFIREFLVSCRSFGNSSDPFLTGIDCIDVEHHSRVKKVIVFPITNNDRGKSYTTASALLGLLRFPEFVFTKKDNPRSISTIINLLKNHYMKHAFGFEKNASSDVKESYYGWPHYNANYILWLKLAELGISISYNPSNSVHGPMSYINCLNSIGLHSTILRQNYMDSTRKVLSLGSKFLTQVNPTFVEFIEERKRVLSL